MPVDWSVRTQTKMQRTIQLWGRSFDEEAEEMGMGERDPFHKNILTSNVRKSKNLNM